MPDTLSAGGTHSILQNVVYCLPPTIVNVQALAAVEVSLDNSTWATLSNSTTGAQTVAKFVRCTTGNTTISVKRA